MKTYDKYETAIIGLFHDIGKFEERTMKDEDLSEYEKKNCPGGDSHFHCGYTARFYQNYLHENEKLSFISSRHHLSETEENKDIKASDQNAAKIERNDKDIKDFKNSNRKHSKRISSIFPELNFRNQDAKNNHMFLSLNKLTDFSGFCKIHHNIEQEKAIDEYDGLFKEFIKELNEKTKEFNDENKFNKHMFNMLYALIYNYLFAIPEATNKTNKSYTSLFEHSKLTAAIFSCLRENDDYKNQEYYIFEFDISGIQKFIYKIVEGKDTKENVAKTLRGRSFLISVLCNSISYQILKEFNLTQANIIFNTGGGATLLLPKNEDFEEKIESICQKTQEKLFNLFGTEITFVYAGKKVNITELINYQVETKIEIKQNLEIEKQQKYHKIIENNLDEFLIRKYSNNQLCKMCGINNADQNDLCNICHKVIDLANFLTKNPKFYILYSFDKCRKSDNSDLVIDLKFVKLKFLKNDVNFAILKDENYDFIDSINCANYGNVRYISNLVPLDKENKVYSFSEIASFKNQGDEKLAILKMDVDNLGIIFSCGLMEKKSFAKYISLSRYFELFFGKIIDEICLDVSKKVYGKQKNIFYINYSGGDDLVIMGPVAAILDLAEEINNRFKGLVGNQDIHISAGIYIQNPKFPIRFGVQYAEEQLAKSKMMSCKNHITLFDISIDYCEYKDIIAQYKTIIKEINEQKVSRSLIYSLMKNLSAEGNTEKEKYKEILRNIPIMQYQICRNLEHDERLKNKYTKLIQNIDVNNRGSYLLIFKIVILLTREDYKNV